MTRLALFTLLLGSNLLVASPSFADEFTVDYRQASLLDVTKQVGIATGKHFIIAGGVKADITMMSAHKVNADDLYHLFRKALHVNHLSLVEDGNIVVIEKRYRNGTRRKYTIKPLPEVDNPALNIGTRLSALRQHLYSNIAQAPAIATQYIRIRASKVNNQLVGYRVYSGRKRDLFRKTGLKQGDLVKAINNIPVDNPLALAAEAKKASSFTLLLANRQGVERKITINLAE